MPAMPDPDSSSRPKRNRTMVSTYSLKNLSDNAHHTHLHPSNRTTRDGADRPRSLPAHTNMDNTNCAGLRRFICPASSSPLSSLIDSPGVLQESIAPAHLLDTSPTGRPTPSRSSIAKNRMTEYECFNGLSNARGHYYSASALQARGVWVGYLAPDKQKKQYFGLPSFNELKTNFHDITLPFPPTNEAISASNPIAVCRGCFGEQSALLTLRELHFVHNRKVVILPLDGDDEVGMFCILLAQSLDRSMKQFQTWRPYEIRNGGTGKEFDNNFVLFTLRDTQNFGTLEVMRAALDPQDLTPPVAHTASQILNASSFASVVPTVEGHHPHEIHYERARTEPPNRAARHMSGVPSLIDRAIKRRKRGPGDSRLAQSPRREVNHRTMPKPVEPEPPQTKRCTPVPSEGSNDIPKLIATRVEEQALVPNLSGRSDERPTRISQSKEQPTLRGLTDEQAQEISIVWKLDIDGDACELPFTLAECRSFSGMLETLREVAQSLPSATAILENTNLWRLAYPLPGGKRKTQMARKGTEVAFDRMWAELAQSSSLDQGSIEVELQALG